MTEAFRMAGAAIWAQMRSLLTMLGIIIGIASIDGCLGTGADHGGDPEQYRFARHQHLIRVQAENSALWAGAE